MARDGRPKAWVSWGARVWQNGCVRAGAGDRPGRPLEEGQVRRAVGRSWRRGCPLGFGSGRLCDLYALWSARVESHLHIRAPFWCRSFSSMCTGCASFSRLAVPRHVRTPRAHVLSRKEIARPPPPPTPTQNEQLTGTPPFHFLIQSTFAPIGFSQVMHDPRPCSHFPMASSAAHAAAFAGQAASGLGLIRKLLHLLSQRTGCVVFHNSVLKLSSRVRVIFPTNVACHCFGMVRRLLGLCFATLCSNFEPLGPASGFHRCAVLELSSSFPRSFLIWVS